MPPQQNSTIPDLTKPASNAYDFFKPPVAVSVGNPPTTFHVNASILCTTSGYFQHMLSEKGAPDKEPPIRLPQHEPAAFNIYLNWLHRGKLFINKPTGKSAKGNEEVIRESFWENILESYFLGSKLDDPDFKDALVDAALLAMLDDDEGVTWYPGRRIRQRLYERTTPGSRMRRLFVHMAASLTNVKELVRPNDDPLQEPLPFLQELQRQLASGEKESTYEMGLACTFHEHRAGEKNCYRAKKTALI
ncbi:hypothetical protein PRZ48_009356 [Zasmidium cellare]|uniref:BTB domain-containing protein n=1 Tax=Zasmidium cellare TaxID=395010 RepID=A0ABR0EC56_ZASCE|nr:hypothetical protein PRZ48_009356 [Zasmidium cellare]